MKNFIRQEEILAEYLSIESLKYDIKYIVQNLAIAKNPKLSPHITLSATSAVTESIRMHDPEASMDTVEVVLEGMLSELVERTKGVYKKVVKSTIKLLGGVGGLDVKALESIELFSSNKATKKTEAVWNKSKLSRIKDLDKLSKDMKTVWALTKVSDEYEDLPKDIDLEGMKKYIKNLPITKVLKKSKSTGGLPDGSRLEIAEGKAVSKTAPLMDSPVKLPNISKLYKTAKTSREYFSKKAIVEYKKDIGAKVRTYMKNDHIIHKSPMPHEELVEAILLYNDKYLSSVAVQTAYARNAPMIISELYKLARSTK